MMSKLQHVINHMDMYRILTETFLAWKGVEALRKHLLYWFLNQRNTNPLSWLFYMIVILQDANFAVQDYDVSLSVFGRS